MVLVLAMAVATAGAGTTASRFGGAGTLAEPLGTHFNQTGFHRVEALPDGGLVAERDGMFETYSAAGALSSTAPTPAYGRYATSAPAAGGKRLVLRNFSELTRRYPDGSLDPSFGDAGRVGLTTGAQALAELPSGKVLLAGCQIGPKGGSWLVIQLRNADGSLDKGFGSGGYVYPDLGPGAGHFCASEIVVTPDGGGLLIGSGFMLRLLSGGTPNPDFGSAGVVAGAPELISARFLADGSIEAVGSARSRSGSDFTVARYSAAGMPDAAFGPNGVRRFDFGADEIAHVASWAADGSVLVGGTSEAIGACRRQFRCEETPIVAAFDPLGALDPGFAKAGLLALTSLTDAPADSWSSGVLGLARRPDGSTVAVGTSAPKQTVAFMAAFSAQGALLPDFGEGGLVRLRRPVPSALEVESLIPLPNGDLLAGGNTYVDQNAGPAVARFGPDGRLVRPFGGGRGWVSVANNQATNDLVTNPSGEVLFGTYDYPRSRLVELRARDGSRVASFGSRGIVTLPHRVRIESLGIDGAGGAVVVGTQRNSRSPGVVLRYREDGRPDQRFGNEGRVDLRFRGREVKLGAFGGFSRGRILVGGLTGSFGERRFALTSLLPNGRPDPRFGHRGWSVPFLGAAARSLVLARAGSHIYLAGVVRRDEKRPRVVLLRFDRDGRLDRSFGHAGRRLGPHPAAQEPVAIVPARRGVLVVFGEGSRPLIWFDRDGKVRRQRLGPAGESISGVRAAASGGRLALGWSTYSDATRSLIFHFNSQPLP